MKNIYFAGSIRAGRGDADLYAKIIEELKKYGTVLTEHVGDPNLSDSGEDLSASKIHGRDLKWIKQCGVLVAEVSTPSLGVGYEIAKAIDYDKQVICLYQEGAEKQLSGMIKGCPDVELVTYHSLDDIRGALKRHLSPEADQTR